MSVIATGTLGVADLNDVTASTLANRPTNPPIGALWWDTVGHQLYVYAGGGVWNVSTYGLDIGGTNLLKYTGNFKDTTGWNLSMGTGVTGALTMGTDTVYGTFIQATKTADGGSWWVLQNPNLTMPGGKFVVGRTYTLSFYYKSDFNLYINFMDPDGTDTVFTTNQTVAAAASWTYFTWTFTATATGVTPEFYLAKNATTLGTVSITKIMLEEGNIPSAWSPSPEEVQGGIDNALTQLSELADDSKITRFERSIVRGDLADITGLWLAPTDAMPALTAIDSGTVGQLHSLRRQAKNLGMDINVSYSADYTALGTAYTALNTYLTGLGSTPKVWDVSATSTGSITVDPTVWTPKWKAYYDAYNLLSAEVQEVQKGYSDAAATSIADAQKADQHATVPIVNPTTTISNAPIATVGLPEYQGAHIDSWTWNGRNLLRNTDFSTGVTPGSATAPDNWTFFGTGAAVYSNQGTASYSNQGTLYIVHGTTVDSGIKQTVTLSPSTQYTCSFKLGAETVNSVYARISYYDGAGAVLSTSALNYNLGSSDTYQSFTFTTPATFTTAAFVHGGIAASSTGGYLTRLGTVKIETGATGHVWSAAPEEAAMNQPRYQPITNPIFSTGTSLQMNLSAYGDGTFNDSITWDLNGNITKAMWWNNKQLDNTQVWSLASDATGYKVLKAASFATDMTAGTLKGVKSDYNLLTINAANTFTAGDQAYLSNSDNSLRISVKDSDSGWGETYTPLVDEIGAYFLGWKMCNGTYGTNYAGVGTKTWYPITDTDLSGAFNTTAGVPDIPSTSIGTGRYYYQILHRLGTQVQVQGYTFNGILALIQGSNSISITYPDFTPPITTGTIRYATTLATSIVDTTYLIPTIMHRLVDVDSRTTDESIINTVTESVEYTTQMSGKAAQSSVNGLATQGDLDTTNSTVDGLDKSVNGDPDIVDQNDPNYGGIANRITKFTTSNDVLQTATSTVATYYTGGGLNLIKNSIGYAGDDFWTQYTGSSSVTSLDTSEMESLGFNSGFYYKPDGVNKGVIQTITDIPIGQHLNLSWYLNKKSGKSGDGSYRFYIQIMEGGVVKQQIADNSATVTTGFSASYMTYTAAVPKATGSAYADITLRFIGYGSVEAYLTGIMFTIGDLPIKWTLSTGEVYSSAITMNMNGIRVAQKDANGKDVGYTLMSPDEFAGFYDTNGDGTYEKIFYLNADSTVSKKVKAMTEISMGGMKAKKIPEAPDWQVAYPYGVGDQVAYGLNTYQCTVAGVSGATPPTHTTGTVSDGGVSWLYLNTSASAGWAFVPS
jgi:hypothetical protein